MSQPERLWTPFPARCAMHFDVGLGDRFLWFSSTNWIMWNLWVSTLGGTRYFESYFDTYPGVWRHGDMDTGWTDEPESVSCEACRNALAEAASNTSLPGARWDRP